MRKYIYIYIIMDIMRLGFSSSHLPTMQGLVGEWILQMPFKTKTKVCKRIKYEVDLETPRTCKLQIFDGLWKSVVTRTPNNICSSVFLIVHMNKVWMYSNIHVCDATAISKCIWDYFACCGVHIKLTIFCVVRSLLPAAGSLQPWSQWWISFTRP